MLSITTHCVLRACTAGALYWCSGGLIWATTYATVTTARGPAWTAKQSPRPTVSELKPTGVMVLEGRCGTTITVHETHRAPCHLRIEEHRVDPQLARSSPDHFARYANFLMVKNEAFCVTRVERVAHLLFSSCTHCDPRGWLGVPSLCGQRNYACGN